MAGTPIRELVVKVTVDADTSGLEELDGAQEQSMTSSVALGTALGNLATDLVAVGVEAAKTAAVFIHDLVFGTAEAAAATANMSVALGVNAQQLQRVRGAAARTGAEIGDVDSAIKDFTKNVGDGLRTGTGPAVEQLEVLGLAIEDVDALLQAGDIEGALGLVGDAAAATGNKAVETAALMALMGDAGVKLRPFLEQGSDAIRTMGDEVSATGSVIGDEGLARLSELQDATLLATQTAEGLEAEFALALAPAVTAGADAARDWIAANKEVIGLGVEGALSRMSAAGEVLEPLMRSIVGVFELAAPVVRTLVDAVGPAAAVLIELGEDAIDELTPALGEMFEAIQPVIDAVGTGLAFAFSLLKGPFEFAIARAKGVINVFTFLLETVTDLFGAAVDLGKQMGERWPKAFRVAKSVVEAMLDPMETIRGVLRSIFDFIEKSVAKLELLPDVVAAIRSSLGIDEEGGTIESGPTGFEGSVAQGTTGGRAAVRRRPPPTTAAAEEAPARRRGGGGGGARMTETEATVEDLISGAISAATGGPSQVAGSNALAGTMLITVHQEQIFNAAPTEITFEIASLPAGSTLEDLAAEVVPLIEQVNAGNRRLVFDHFTARNNVGGG